MMMPGTQRYINGQFLISCGIPMLDTTCGGGWYVGSIVLCQDTLMATSGEDIVKSFLAQGNIDAQMASLSGGKTSGHGANIINTLPAVNGKVVIESVIEPTPLDIAWQYTKYASTTKTREPSSRFDFSKIGVNITSTVQHIPVPNNSASCVKERYEAWLDTLRLNVPSGPQVHRLVLLDLGSPLLFGEMNMEHEQALFSFMRNLMEWIRKSASHVTVLITICPSLFGDDSTIAEVLAHHADAVLSLSSFNEPTALGVRAVEFKDICGLLTIRKLPRRHTLANDTPKDRTLGIQRDRKKFRLVKLHLPPQHSRESSSSCSSKMDF